MHISNTNQIRPSAIRTRMDDVYVVQLVSTGPQGTPRDTVAEVAVCRMFADGSDYDTVYNEGVALDPRDLGKEPLDYMLANHGMEPEDLYGGIPEDDVSRRLQEVLEGRDCTSYNVGNVFGRYLAFEPWDLTGEVTLLPSICARLPADLKGPVQDEASLIRKAYVSLCPEDPAGVGDGMRAIHLAQMATSVLMFLRGRGLFRSGMQAHDDVAQEQVHQRCQVDDRVDHEERDREEPGYAGDDEQQRDGGGEEQQPSE